MTVHESIQSRTIYIALRYLGNLKYFISIEVASSKHGIYLSQRKYAIEMLEEQSLFGTLTSKISMEQT